MTFIFKNNALVAYQLAFDLHENAPQEFLENLEQVLFVDKTAENEEEATSELKANLERILGGQETIKHHMQFLIKNNHTDMLILRHIKDAIRGACTHNATVIANGLMHAGTTCDDFLRYFISILKSIKDLIIFQGELGLDFEGNQLEQIQRSGISWTHSQSETGHSDIIIRTIPITLYCRAMNARRRKFWIRIFQKASKINSVIRKAVHSTPMVIGMSDLNIAIIIYLCFQGMIHANHGNNAAIDYLTDQLTKASTSAVRHGACLGLGLAALGTRNMKVYEQLREIMYQHDDAVSGEAAGTAMGLVMAGSMNQTVLITLINQFFVFSISFKIGFR